jgi:hypothetical protein
VPASVGLTIAPKAMPAARPSPGTARLSTTPTTPAESSTSSTDSPLMAANSRRKSIAGIATADAYSSGGSTPTRIHSGSTTTVGTPGTRLTAIPNATSSKSAEPDAVGQRRGGRDRQQAQHADDQGLRHRRSLR